MAQSDDAAPEHASTWRYVLVVGAAAGFTAGAVDVGAYIVARGSPNLVLLATYSLAVSAAAGAVAGRSSQRIESGATAGAIAWAVAWIAGILAVAVSIIWQAIQPVWQPTSGEGILGAPGIVLVVVVLVFEFVVLAIFHILGGAAFGAAAAMFGRWLGQRHGL